MSGIVYFSAVAEAARSSTAWPGHGRGVSEQGITFLNDENGLDIDGVTAAAHLDAGSAPGLAATVNRRCRESYRHRFELLGTTEDVHRVREGLEEL
ncbi:MAG TPA: hypothetical protein VK095_05180 [Beutenbergiaceae bacterium]|nr:hypothetical protein [Beutenbergiaceae bacterium]